VVAQGYVYGRIADRPAGTHGFGYDPIFLLPRLGCTLAELLPGEKHRLSHRGRAVRRLLRRLGAYGAAGGSNRKAGNGR
jgi:XTP/dITP diphosphohydrolase